MAHESYMRRALALAQEAGGSGEIPVGALVVWNGKVIGKGTNQTERLKDVTAHAEMIALTAAANYVGAKYLPEAVLYVTLEPCVMCAGALYWTKIGTVVYGAADHKNGYRQACRADRPNLPFHPKTKLITGILSEECAALMQDFFKSRR